MHLGLKRDLPSGILGCKDSDGAADGATIRLNACHDDAIGAGAASRPPWPAIERSRRLISGLIRREKTFPSVR